MRDGTKEGLTPLEMLMAAALFAVPLVHFRWWVAEQSSYIFEFSWMKYALLGALAFAGLAWSWFRVPGPEEKPRGLVLLPPLAGLIAITAGSLVFETNRHKGVSALAMIAIPAALYLAAATGTRSGRATRIFFHAVAASAALVSLYGILQELEIAVPPKDIYGNKNPFSTIGLTNFAADFLVLAIPLIFTSIMLAEKGAASYLNSAALVLSLIYLVVTKNRAGWVGFAVSAATGAALYLAVLGGRDGQAKRAKKAIIYLTASGAAALVIFGFTGMGSGMKAKLSSMVNPNDPKITVRIEAWKGALDMFYDHPLLGVGAGNFDTIFPPHQSKKLVDLSKATNTRVDDPHNEYLNVLSELGILGALFFAWLLYELYRLSVSAMRSGAIEDRMLLAGPVISIAGILAVSVFAFPLQMPVSSMLFWFCAGLLDSGLNKRDGMPSGAFDGYAEWTLGKLNGWVKSIFLPSSLNIAYLGLILVAGIALCAYSASRSISYNYASIGNLFDSESKWEPAYRNYTEAIGYYGGSEEFYYNRAVCLENMGMDVEAISDLSRAVSFEPFSPTLRRRLGALYSKRQEDMKAIDQYQICLMLEQPPSKETLMAMVVVALRAYQRDRQANPNAPEQLLDMALRSGEAAVALGYDDPSLYFYLGAGYSFKKEYEKSAVMFERVTQLQPENKDARVNLGAILLNLNRPDEAIAMFEKVSIQASEDPYFWYNLASAYALKKNAAKATRNLKIAISLLPKLREDAMNNKTLKDYVPK
jgi:putative inorganic carbon (HCO3(-)) transporter